MGGFGWSWDGRWWLTGEEQRPAAMSNGGGGAPAALGGGGRAWKDQWRSGKLAKGSVWGEDGRRRRLGGGLGGGGGHGVVAPLRVQGEVVVRPGSCARMRRS